MVVQALEELYPDTDVDHVCFKEVIGLRWGNVRSLLRCTAYATHLYQMDTRQLMSSTESAKSLLITQECSYVNMRGQMW
jgi:hypothetical protein